MISQKNCYPIWFVSCKTIEINLCNTISLTTDLSMNMTQNKFLNLVCSQRLEKRHFTNLNVIVLDK